MAIADVLLVIAKLPPTVVTKLTSMTDRFGLLVM